MSSPFLFGIGASIPDSAFLTSDQLFEKVGHNSGNLAFNRAVSQLLGGNRRVISWYAEPSAIDACGDVGVMPCANHLGPHADFGQLATRFAKLKCQLAALGLGAQGAARYDKLPEVPDGTRRWLDEIANRAPSDYPNISVRGGFTYQVLEQLGFANRAVVLGCPTLFINPDPALGEKLEKRWAAIASGPIAIAAGHQSWRHLSKLEASLTRLMSATNGAYIVQSPREMLLLGRGQADHLSDLEISALRDFSNPELTVEEYRIWSKRYAHVFFDIPGWMEYLTRFSLVIGTRIHGVMLGLQAGVPSICIAHDSRTRELCETMMVPFVMASEVAGGITRSQLDKISEFDGAAFDANRRRLGAGTREFLTRNGLPVDAKFLPVMPELNLS